MKYKEKQSVKKTTVQELLKEIEELEKKLRKLNVDRHVKEMKNTREGRNIRKRIAIVATFLKEKQFIKTT